jgi:DNA-binding transcriptional LysR family regulator
VYEVRRLRLLKELADRGTLAEVAAALRYSPSSVSQQLALLEREVGVPLLVPSGRRVVLTPEAQALADRAGEVLDLLERAESEVAARTVTVAGTVRLAIFQSAALALLPETLTVMAQDHPQVRVEVVQHEPELALERTATRDFDLVVAEQYPGHTREHRAGITRTLLGHDSIRLATAMDDAAVELADLADRPWVMEPVGTAAREWTTQQCRAAGFEPDVPFELADLTAHVTLIGAGAAVGMLPTLVFAGAPAPVRLADLPGAQRRDVFVATRSGAADRPGIRAVRDALQTAFDDARVE